jgi:hypothetical protein
MYIISALVLLITWMLIRKRKAKWIPWFLAPIVLFLASTAFALSDFGRWVARVPFGWLTGIPAAFGGPSAAVTATCVLALLLLATLLDLLADKKADKWAKTGIMLIPLLALIAVGPLSQSMNNVTTNVGRVGTQGIDALTGK